MNNINQPSAAETKHSESCSEVFHWVLIGSMPAEVGFELSFT